MKTLTAAENITYSRLVEILNRENICYSLLRDNILENAVLGELDILIWPEDRSRFIDVLKRAGFVLHKSGIPGKEVFAAYNGRHFLLLDVHYALIQNGLTYLPLAGLEHRLETTLEGARILSAEDRLLHLFYHNLIGKRRLQEKQLEMVQQLINSQLDTAYLKNAAPDTDIQEILTAFMESPEAFCEKKDVAQDKSLVIIEALKKQSKKNRLNYIKYNKLRSRKPARKGVHFAFLGVDGAGKSTLVETVQKHLRESGKLKYRFVYMGPWGYIRSPILKAVYAIKFFPPKENWPAILREKLSGGAKEYGLLSILQKLVTGSIKGWTYYAAVYMEQCYRYLKEIRPQVKKGRIVLSDRYTYDLRYIYKKRPMKPFRIWRWFVCRFFPKPDRVVFVFNSAEDIIARKPQLGVEEINLFQKYYRKVLVNYPMLEMKSDRPPDEMAAIVVNEIMKIYLDSSRK